MRPRSFLAIFALFLPISRLRAQVNIERFRRASAPTGWTVATTGDLALRTGNVDLVLIGLGARVDRVERATRTMLLLDGDVGWERGRRFSNRGLAHLRHSFAATRRIYPETFAQVDYDRSRALLFRALVGLGPRAELVRGAAGGVRLFVGTAYMLEYERFDLPPTAVHPLRTTRHRWSSYVAASVGSGEPFHAAATTYVQPRFDDLGDVRLLFDGSVAARAGGPASLTLGVALRYDSRPPDGAKALDAAVRSGVALEW